MKKEVWWLFNGVEAHENTAVHKKGRYLFEVQGLYGIQSKKSNQLTFQYLQIIIKMKQM